MLSKIRTWAITGLIITGITLVLLEGVAYVTFGLLAERQFDRQAIEADVELRQDYLHEILSEDGEDTVFGLYTQHPYLGFTGREGARLGETEYRFDAYGVINFFEHEYPYTKTENELVVLILGGSVADGFAVTARDALQNHLTLLDPVFADREVTFVSLATGGFKQPQSVIQLMIALAEGFEFDIVLNIDGFNELVMGVENIEKGIHPMLPSILHMDMLASQSGVMTVERIRMLADVMDASENERGWLEWFSVAPLRYSAFGNLLRVRTMTMYDSRRKAIQQEMRSDAVASLYDVYTGPPFPVGDEKRENIELAVRYWKSFSQMIHALCLLHDKMYIHVLQPNQYFEGSKHLTEEELSSAFSLEPLWSQIAKEGYPRLVEGIHELQQRNVPAYDLTMIFVDEEETIYYDACCHFNQQGNEIMARTIAEIIDSRKNEIQMLN